jgi:hypothetical protein
MLCHREISGTSLSASNCGENKERVVIFHFEIQFSEYNLP